jgi:hypothetical protein
MQKAEVGGSWFKASLSKKTETLFDKQIKSKRTGCMVLSGGVLAYSVQGPEFKLSYHFQKTILRIVRYGGALGKWRWEDCEMEARLGDRVSSSSAWPMRPCLKNLRKVLRIILTLVIGVLKQNLIILSRNCINLVA